MTSALRMFVRDYLLITSGIGAIVGASKSELKLETIDEEGKVVAKNNNFMKLGSIAAGAYVGAVLAPAFPVIYISKRVVDVSATNGNLRYEINTRFPE